jgi:antitoxin component YwqK of YwqJK toxin-antitoxin module
MKTRILLFILFTVGVISSNAQPFDSEKLLGTWELSEKKNDLDSDLTLNIGSSNKSKKDIEEIILYFQNDNVLDFISSGTQFKAQYQLQDSILHLGNRTYKITNLSDDELVMEDQGDYKITTTTYVYKRSDKLVEPIKEKEIFEEHFDNGRLKTQGLIQNGFRNGIWTEWFENGNVKTVSHLKDEALIMKVEFDETGAIKSKTRLDFMTGEYINE